MSALRRKYFALCKELGLDDDARHEVNESILGRQSTKGATDSELGRLVEHLSVLVERRSGRPERVRRFTRRFATAKVPAEWKLVRPDWGAVNLGWAIGCEIVELRHGAVKRGLSVAQKAEVEKILQTFADKASGGELAEQFKRDGWPTNVPPAAYLIEEPDRGVRELSTFLRILKNSLAAERKRHRSA